MHPFYGFLIGLVGMGYGLYLNNRPIEGDTTGRHSASLALILGGVVVMIVSFAQCSG